jgi:phosphoenolpyruvate synthase/pyruvate phosphate dikinase
MYPMTETSEFKIQYHKEHLLKDSWLRNTFITKIAQIGVIIEELYGKVPQDIEGAYFNNQYYVVQTRPQV